MSKDSFFSSYKDNMKEFNQFMLSKHEITSLLGGDTGHMYNNQRVLNSAAKGNNISVEVPSFDLTLLAPIQCGAKTDSYLSIGGYASFNTDGIVEQSISVCIKIRPHTDIEPNISFGTGSIESSRQHIIRRFHFDIDSNQKRSDRPISHIQYGGNIKDSQKGESSYHLISSIDLPRIPSIPLDIIQVMNFVMLQFENNLTKTFQTPAWRNIVVNNDKIWKKFYFEKLMNSVDKRKTFYEWSCSPITFP
ncbi:hypothetical protein ACK31R_17495 [Aeromonas caviae]